MDYARIYRDFIRDRMANPPEADEYAESHHILPRCMGGTDDPWNLIRLTRRDHFFAHLCLAKTYDIPPLWYAVFLMINSRGKSKRSIPIRREYVWLDRQYPRGEDHNSADRTEYHFRHPDGREMRCNRHEFCKAFGFENANISWFISGKNKSFRGWYMPTHNPQGVFGSALQSLNGGDRDLYLFRHATKGDMLATRRDFSAACGVNQSALSMLVGGQRKSANGWYLPDHNPKGIIHGVNARGVDSPRADPTTYTFSHDVGEVLHATRQMMVERSGLPSRHVNNLISGTNLSAGGWMMHSTRLSAERVRKPTGEIVTFVHPVKGEFSGTRSEVARHIGVTPYAVTYVMQGKGKASRGWSLKKTEEEAPGVTDDQRKS